MSKTQGNLDPARFLGSNPSPGASPNGDPSPKQGGGASLARGESRFRSRFYFGPETREWRRFRRPGNIFSVENVQNAQGNRSRFGSTSPIPRGGRVETETPLRNRGQFPIDGNNRLSLRFRVFCLSMLPHLQKWITGHACGSSGCARAPPQRCRRLGVKRSVAVEASTALADPENPSTLPDGRVFFYFRVSRTGNAPLHTAYDMRGGMRRAREAGPTRP